MRFGSGDESHHYENPSAIDTDHCGELVEYAYSNVSIDEPSNGTFSHTTRE